MGTRRVKAEYKIGHLIFPSDNKRETQARFQATGFPALASLVVG